MKMGCVRLGFNFGVRWRWDADTYIPLIRCISGAQMFLFLEELVSVQTVLDVPSDCCSLAMVLDLVTEMRLPSVWVR